MANQKQDGSNITNAEYSTGRCPTRCEQCFVNYGQQGMATCKGIVRPDRKRSFEFIKAQAKEFGLYTPPPKQTAAEKRKWPTRLGAIRKNAKGFYNIPAIGAWDSWIIKRPPRLVEGVPTLMIDGKRYPLFLRVNSMSDSSWAPGKWIQLVEDAWGDYCFFNSSIRSIKIRPDNLDLYNKLVVTMNPGFQEAPPMEPRVGLKASEVENPLNYVYGSMKGVKNKKRDFLNPQTLTGLGYGNYEDVIKFYRERALPTVRGRIRDEEYTGAPIVVTQMRFVSLAHACEFCRRYKLNIEAILPKDKLLVSGLPAKKQREILEKFGVPYSSYDGSASRFRIWSDPNDDRNTSIYRGDASEYVWYDGYYRVDNIEAFDIDPYVCDRVHGSCKMCGLCATLDGTQKDNTNWSNIGPDGAVMAPIPYLEGAFYTGSPESSRGDVLREIYADVSGDGYFEDYLDTIYSEGRVRNPAEPDLNWIATALSVVGVYVDKEMSTDEDFVEGWDTHEHAATLTAYCYWALMRHARRAGMQRDEAFDWIDDFVDEASEGEDLASGVGDLVEMWDNQSSWNGQFGPTSP